MSSPTRRAVVTGGTGHLGTNLVHRLVDQGWAVTVLGAEPTSQRMVDLDDLPVERRQLAIDDPLGLTRAFAGADVVFHLAGMVSILERDANAMWSVNVGGTANVLAAASAAGVGRLVHFSSVLALEPNPGGVLDEDRPLVADRSAPSYDLSKAAAERLVFQAVESGLDAVMVNPTGVFGPLDRGPSLLGQMLCNVWTRSLPAVVAGGFNWVDVRDVADGAIAAAEVGHAGRRYVLGGTWATHGELAEAASVVAGVHPPRVTVPLPLASAVAPISARWSAWRGTAPQFSPASVRTMKLYPEISIDRARRELGYAPRPLVESLADVHRWFVDHGALADVVMPDARAIVGV